MLIFVQEGKLWSYHVLRVVCGWELWVGTQTVMSDPLLYGIFQYKILFWNREVPGHSGHVIQVWYFFYLFFYFRLRGHAKFVQT